MKLSKKKETELYDSVYQDIMDARVKIARILGMQSEIGKEVDNALYDLCKNAPENAIKLFIDNPLTPEQRKGRIMKAAERNLDMIRQHTHKVNITH